jgi:hypothetical protein
MTIESKDCFYDALMAVGWDRHSSASRLSTSRFFHVSKTRNGIAIPRNYGLCGKIP